VNVAALPTVGLVGDTVKLAVSASGLIVMEAVAVAVFALPSVTVTLTLLVPFELYVVVKLAPVPEAGLPPVAVHANVYGAVPPVADAVNVTAVPTVPVVGPDSDTDNVRAAIVIVADAVAVAAFASVRVTDTVYVPLTL
jgi:hypothetical protein